MDQKIKKKNPTGHLVYTAKSGIERRTLKHLLNSSLRNDRWNSSLASPSVVFQYSQVTLEIDT